MGCDIHVVVERKCPDGKWRVVNPEPVPEATRRLRPDELEWGLYNDEPSPMEILEFEMQPKETREPPRAEMWWFERNYQAFSQLADVRSLRAGANLWPVRGFPEDASPLTKSAFDCPDWHSPNWLTGAELAEYPKLVDQSEKVPRIEELASALSKVATEQEVSMDEVRAVFWFDS